MALLSGRGEELFRQIRATKKGEGPNEDGKYAEDRCYRGELESSKFESTMKPDSSNL